MKVDFSQPITDLDGKQLEEAGKKITLAVIAANALLATDQNEQASGVEKAKCFSLAQKVYGGGTVELSLDDVETIKAKVGKFMAPLVVGQAFDVFEDAAGKPALRTA